MGNFSILQIMQSSLKYFVAGLDAFRTFLKSEFSEENVEFWLACEDFKKTESREKIASKAKMIYSEFIVADAPKEVSKAFEKSEVAAQAGCSQLETELSLKRKLTIPFPGEKMSVGPNIKIY